MGCGAMQVGSASRQKNLPNTPQWSRLPVPDPHVGDEQSYLFPSDRVQGEMELRSELLVLCVCMFSLSSPPPPPESIKCLPSTKGCPFRSLLGDHPDQHWRHL